MAEKINNEEDQMIKDMDERTEANRIARAYGKSIGNKLNKKYQAPSGLNTSPASSAISEILYQCYLKKQKTNCGDYLLRRINEKLWGKIVEPYIDTIEEIWQYLHDNKHTKDNYIMYGDADAAIWVEYPKKDNKKVIIHTSYSSTKDDNTHIFILNNTEETVLPTLHVRTVWPREKTNKRSKGLGTWGDDRDIIQPSLNTYRKRNFKFSYQDCRDIGYVLSLYTIRSINIDPVIDRADLYQNEIKNAISIIDMMKQTIIERKNKE